MIAVQRQHSYLRRRVGFFRLHAGLFLLLWGGMAVAGEGTVDPASQGTDLRDDTTEDVDSRSSEVAAAAENILGLDIYAL